MTSLARASLELFIARTEAPKERYLEEMVADYGADGIVFHDCRTCPNISNTRYGMPRRLGDRLGIPTLVLDGDVNDLRCFSDEQARTKIRKRIEAFAWRPKFSIIMPVFDPPLEFLDEAIRSVREQIYRNWELCIADDASKNEAIRDLLKKHTAEDGRIRLVLRKENGHISKASNSAL